MSCVILGDLHFPYHDQWALARALSFVKAHKPKFVIQIGDLYDFANFSKYPKSILDLSPEQEVKKGNTLACELWETVKAVSPKSKCFQLLGNHCDRPFKRLIEKAPELEIFYNHNDLFRFPGVETIFDSRQELTLKVEGHEVMFMHGHRARLGDHMLYNQMSTVCGHSHTGGVVYKGYRKETRFELNAGYLADPNAGPLQYGAQSKRYWTHGIGMIDALGPRFIPFTS